nr:DUF2256 domain-containing protein [Hyphomonas sp. Mor2]
MAHKKPTLLSRICSVCNRPFTWRKKWERNWGKVKSCSSHCRAASRSGTAAP